jgi:hypothetical protein
MKFNRCAIKLISEKFEDTKGCKSKKERQCNCQEKKDKRTNNYLKIPTQKTKGRVIHT